MSPPPPPRLPSRAPRPPHRGPSLARRALPALALTGASGLLLSLLDHPGASVGAASGATTPDTGSGAASPLVTMPPSVSTPATTGAPSPGRPTPTSAAPAPAAPASAAPSSAAPATSAPRSTVPPAPTACAPVTGPTVRTRWGPVEVKASVAPDGRICAVDAIVTPSDRSRSIAINTRAVPVLDAAALAAQGTSFHGVSGATITSNGYKASLQAILDRLG